VRLYERHAAQQPEGPARTRATAVAFGVSTLSAPIDLARLALTYAPDIRVVDHRVFATWSSESRVELLEQFRHQLELAPDFAARIDGVLGIAPGGLAVSISYFGTSLDSGGVFENRLCDVYRFDDDGRMSEAETFEAEQEAEALARFEALLGRGAEPARDPFDNAASRADRLLFDRFNARDWPAIEALAAPDLVFDERRRMVRNTCGRDVWLEQFRVLFDVPASRFTTQLVATRGERLALNLHCFTGEVAGGGGPLAMDDHLVLHEVDRDGRIVAIVLFDLEDEYAAHTELDARFEAGEGAAYARTLAAWRRREHAMAIRDWDAFNATRSPGFVFRDHRLLGFGTMNEGASLERLMPSLVDLAPDVRRRHEHIRLCERGILEHLTQFGTRDGGAFENVFLAVSELDAQDRTAAIDNYNVEDLDRALARFAELVERDDRPHAVATLHFENTAMRAWDRVGAAWRRQDWERFDELLAQDFLLSERRRLVLLELDRRQYLDEYVRPLREMSSAQHATELIATRGDRLALTLNCLEVADADIGPSEISHLTLIEVNDRGCVTAMVRWNPEDLDAAYAELDARYDVLAAALHPRVTAARIAQRRLYRDRDWVAFAATHAPDLVCHDHRLLGWGTLRGIDAWMRTQQVLVELAPDTGVRNDHFMTSEHGYLRSARILGTRDGGAFELALLRVDEVDAAGKVCRIDLYDVDDVEAALARFAEVAARGEAGLGPFENTASRAWRAVNEAWTARDLERFEALHAAFQRYRDHRRLFQLDLDRVGFLDFTRPLLTMRAGHASLDLVATRGERLALMHSVMRMEDDTVGPSTIESLMMIEADARGAIAAYDRWDLEDEEAAHAELDAQWEADEGALHPQASAWAAAFRRAFASRDWDAMSALQAPDQVANDYRLVGWGTLRGAGAWTPTLRELVALAPDVRQRVDHLRVTERGLLWHHAWQGTRDGGEFESLLLLVVELDEDGLERRIDVWEADRFDAALARFEEIRASERRDPLAAIAKPNRATASMERSWVAFDTLDLDAANEALEAARATFAPDFVWEDRRPVVGLSGGLDLMIASARERLASGARHERRTIIATVGERIAIARVLWAGGPADGRFEVEFLVVHEVDEAGLCTALIFFEPDDPRAAQREAWARWAAIDPAVAPWVELLDELTDAWNAHDVARFRTSLGDDFVLEDHRLAGLGRIEGADAYMDSFTALWELAPDQRVEFGQWHAVAPHGVVLALRRAGTLESGGAFENEYAWLALASNGRVTHVETFEIEALDAALARFEELRPDPLRIPETTATRMRDRNRDAFLARDWDAMRALTGADFVHEDRGKRALVRGDVEIWIASMEFTSQPGFRTDSALIGTLGDRIALDRIRWFGKPGGDAFEFERVRLLEVGADGLLRAVLFFDPEDRSAASVEGLARFAAGEAAGSAGATPLTALSRALLDRDWEAVRECFAPDLVVVDHRPLSLGTLDREPWIASLQAVDELGDGVVWEVFRVLACNEQGFVKGVRRLGTIAGGGGPFENEVYAAALVADGRIQRYEVFGEADAERAVARFAELCAERA
jgi:ketosteroid isomerase-like protein